MSKSKSFMITDTAFKLTHSQTFWDKRVQDQLAYMAEVRFSDRTPERKMELLISAQNILMRCLFHADLCRWSASLERELFNITWCIESKTMHAEFPKYPLYIIYPAT